MTVIYALSVLAGMYALCRVAANALDKRDFANQIRRNEREGLISMSTRLKTGVVSQCKR